MNAAVEHAHSGEITGLRIMFDSACTTSQNSGELRHPISGDPAHRAGQFQRRRRRSISRDYRRSDRTNTFELLFDRSRVSPPARLLQLGDKGPLCRSGFAGSQPREHRVHAMHPRPALARRPAAPFPSPRGAVKSVVLLFFRTGADWVMRHASPRPHPTLTWSPN